MISFVSYSISLLSIITLISSLGYLDPLSNQVSSDPLPYGPNMFQLKKSPSRNIMPLTHYRFP